jgi:hypothetical protein
MKEEDKAKSRCCIKGTTALDVEFREIEEKMPEKMPEMKVGNLAYKLIDVS